ncbi:hypothetical protein F4859DRAFT_489127, partial [Xylaria cf. heliscus]
MGRDMNAYSAGWIGCHDVVLVRMQGMGRTPTTTVAASCRTSFLGINLALVVVMCGAGPFNDRSTEILLGACLRTGQPRFQRVAIRAHNLSYESFPLS